VDRAIDRINSRMSAAMMKASGCVPSGIGSSASVTASGAGGKEHQRPGRAST
jgi:hypothetical protein